MGLSYYRYKSIRLDSIMVENEAKSASVVKFKEMIGKIMEEENTMVLYPYSSSSSAVPITAMARMPNTFTELKRYVPSIKPPLKDSDLVYGQIYIGTNSDYADWKATFLEWSKDNGHGLFLKYVQDERLTVLGYLLYTHKMSNAPWYQGLLSKKKHHTYWRTIPQNKWTKTKGKSSYTSRMREK